MKLIQSKVDQQLGYAVEFLKGYCADQVDAGNVHVSNWAKEHSQKGFALVWSDAVKNEMSSAITVGFVDLNPRLEDINLKDKYQVQIKFRDASDGQWDVAYIDTFTIEDSPTLLPCVQGLMEKAIAILLAKRTSGVPEPETA